MTQLSPHFTLEELCFSQEALRVGVNNTPDADAIANLTLLCSTLLEPIRDLLGVPLHVDSGYRSPVINADVGGSSKSAHLTGCAADCIPIGLDLKMCFSKIQISGLPFDQLILECSAWLHIGMVQSGNTAPPRRECLLAYGGPGNWEYLPA